MSGAKEQVDRVVGAAADKVVAAVASPTAAAAARPVTHRVARLWRVGAAVFLALLLIMLAPALLALTMLLAAEDDTNGDVAFGLSCDPGQIGSLDQVQSTRAAEIVATADRVVGPWAERQGLPVQATVARAAVIAIATALQESGLRNLASQRMPESLNYDHDGVAPGDHQSVGTFQQQPWWWPGGMADGMNPVYEARQFYGGDDAVPSIPGLLDVQGWYELPVTVAAQEVQRSAFPSAYADDEPLATATVNQLMALGMDVCAGSQVSTSGDVVNPLPSGSYVLTGRFGVCNALWENCHSGLDFGAPAGTPIRAATGGTVTFSGWMGTYGQVVFVDHGDGVETRYAHMSRLGSQVGDVVQPGDTIGLVGTTGNSTGNHLHFEVRLDGVPVNPEPWLTERGVQL